ncbi:hypothetical protein ACFFRR_007058 [Megaselia abdita]
MRPKLASFVTVWCVFDTFASLVLLLTGLILVNSPKIIKLIVDACDFNENAAIALKLYIEVMTPLMLISVISSFSFFKGLFEKNHNYMVPYIICNAVTLVMNIPQILCLYALFFGYVLDYMHYNGSYKNDSNQYLTFVTLIIAITNLVLRVYALVEICSLWIDYWSARRYQKILKNRIHRNINTTKIYTCNMQNKNHPPV